MYRNDCRLTRLNQNCDIQSVSERQLAKWTMIVKLQPSRSTFSIFALLNSEVTAPIFTKISHDVEALISTTINPYIYKTMLHFVSKCQRVKMVNFDVCKKAPKLIGYHSNVSSTDAKIISVLQPAYTSLPMLFGWRSLVQYLLRYLVW